MEEYPAVFEMLMDELSSVEFCKLAFYKLNKMKIETVQELEELEKVMCKAMDLSTKLKLDMISPALRERFFRVVAENGLDKPPSLLTNIAKDYLKMPSSVKRESPIFLEENQPKLFHNTSKPSDVDPNSYKSAQKPGLFRIKSETISPSRSCNREEDLYKSGMLQLDSIKQAPGTDAGGRVLHKSFRRESPSTPRAYRSKSRARSQSRRRERETSRSPSPPPYKRFSSRPRRSRTRSPPSVRSYSRFEDRMSRSPSRSYTRRSRRSPPSPWSFSARRASPGRRSRSPPSTTSFSRRSRSPPSTRAFSRKSRSPSSVREVRKDDEEGVARKSGLSFVWHLARKYLSWRNPLSYFKWKWLSFS